MSSEAVASHYRRCSGPHSLYTIKNSVWRCSSVDLYTCSTSFHSEHCRGDYLQGLHFDSIIESLFKNYKNNSSVLCVCVSIYYEDGADMRFTFTLCRVLKFCPNPTRPDALVPDRALLEAG